MGQIKLHKDLEDNSNEDDDWTKSKEMLLQEDSEIFFSIATSGVLKRCMNINLIFMLNESILSNLI